jgi:hypothetical protein
MKWFDRMENLIPVIDQFPFGITVPNRGPVRRHELQLPDTKNRWVDFRIKKERDQPKLAFSSFEEAKLFAQGILDLNPVVAVHSHVSVYKGLGGAPLKIPGENPEEVLARFGFSSTPENRSNSEPRVPI